MIIRHGHEKRNMKNKGARDLFKKIRWRKVVGGGWWRKWEKGDGEVSPARLTTHSQGVRNIK